jgi:hypothetical protein
VIFKSFSCATLSVDILNNVVVMFELSE